MPTRIRGRGCLAEFPRHGSHGPNANQEEARKGQVEKFEGMLRRLAEKELILDTHDQGMLRFRLLARTQFRNRKGEPVRELLLKPGDQLEVQCDADDPETARVVVFLREGTAAEREAAARPLEAAAPSPAPAAAPAAAPSSGAAPASLPAAPQPGEEPEPDPLIVRARTAMAELEAAMPDFVVEQVTTRYASFNNEATWNMVDRIEAELVWTGGREEYRNVRLNGRPIQGGPESTGAWSTGEFLTTAADILSPATRTGSVRLGRETVQGQPAVVFEFSIRAEDSHWTPAAPHGRTAEAGAEGPPVDRRAERPPVADRAAGRLHSSLVPAGQGRMHGGICAGAGGRGQPADAGPRRDARLRTWRGEVLEKRDRVPELPAIPGGIHGSFQIDFRSVCGRHTPDAAPPRRPIRDGASCASLKSAGCARTKPTSRDTT